VPSKYNTNKVLTDCDRIVRVWTDNPTFALGEVTLVSLKAKMAGAREKREQLEALRMQVDALSNEVETETAELSAIRSRALSGLRATYGPNSTQYGQGGGTRQDDKRKSTRKGGGGEGGSSK
jgi:hypothetical protein